MTQHDSCSQPMPINAELAEPIEPISAELASSPRMLETPIGTFKQSTLYWIGAGGAASLLVIAMAGISMLVVIGAASTSGQGPANYQSSQSSDSSMYGYDPYGAPMADSNAYQSPADSWLNGNEWNGRMSSGTTDPNPRHSVYSVDGEVITLP